MDVMIYSDCGYILCLANLSEVLRVKSGLKIVFLSSLSEITELDHR